ncbi:hypothetical protein ACG9Y7_11065 [Acinetobacter gerneri]|uniref:hypothetical protein n=1 Tax=Acinetobacter gerneri TaxID=202952 RepID=UPI003AF8978B
MTDTVICVGGPLHKLKVQNGGSWFQINKDGIKEYSVSTILNSEYSDKYVRSCVYPAPDSNESIEMYIWENNQKYIKQFFYGS